MKKSLLLLVLAAASWSATAQKKTPATPVAVSPAAPTGYTDLMAATINDLMNTGDPAELRELASKLERAATVAPADWLPRYYQAYALLINVFQSKDGDDQKDKTLDQAEAALAQARRLGGDESELLVLQAYIYQARLGISPVIRSMRYAGLVTEAVAQARKLNPANPRAYLVDANNVYYTPKMFGGGADVARPMYEEAKARYAAFKPASALAPNWGERQVMVRLKSYETAAAGTK